MLTIVDSSELFTGSSIPYGVKTGVPMLDLALGRCGWPAGRIIEIYGFEGSGKSSIGLMGIANVQRMGGIGIYIDSEKTFDPVRAEVLGVKLDYGNTFLVIEVKSLDAGFRAIQNICQSMRDSGLDRPVLMVYDSVTGAPNEYDLEQELGKEQRTGHEAKVIRQGIRAVATEISETKAILLLVNHAIAKITSYGKQSQAAGGHAIKLWASNRVELKNIGKVKDKDKTILGMQVKICLEKNKVSGITIDEVEIDLMNQGGFDTAGNLLEACIRVEMVGHKKGSKDYTFTTDEGEEVVFPREGWPKLCAQYGGVYPMYDLFYKYCISHGHMRTYGK